jgi:hypothetical protein
MSLRKIKWNKKTKVQSIQKDSNNCGVFVAEYLRKILSDEDNLLFDTSQDNIFRIRMEIVNTLKKNTAKNFCSVCGNLIQFEEKIIKDSCFHRYHQKCLSDINKDFVCPICL